MICLVSFINFDDVDPENIHTPPMDNMCTASHSPQKNRERFPLPDFFKGGVAVHRLPITDVTKILCCRLNTTSRQGIKWQGISFGSIFLLFSYESSQGPHA